MQKKMTNQERAKIFAPFDALKGFKEALKDEEVIKMPKVMLSEDQEVDLDNILKQLLKGMMIEVIHYNHECECYLKTIGVFTKIDKVYKKITIIKKKINIEDIIDIKIIENTLSL